MSNKPEPTYAEMWAGEINDTYAEPEWASFNLLNEGDLQPGEDYREAEKRILGKAAKCLRAGVPATFTAGELDLVRHLMPAHEVHQSGAARWVLDNYGVQGAGITVVPAYEE
jgi:hypothetical protein